MLNGLIRHPLNFFWNGLLLPLLGWIFIVPFTLLIPRKKQCVIFWGRDRGYFTDNVKYLYLHLWHFERGQVDLYFLTESKAVYDQLKDRNMPVLFFPRFKTFWYLLRAGVIVADSDVWINHFRFHLLFTAYKIQLWHGVGLKTIGLDNPQIKQMLQHAIMRAYFHLKGKLVRYDLLITTGDAFVDRGYVTGLRKKRTEPTGYPRNDVFFGDFKGDEQIGVEAPVFDRVGHFRRDGGRIAVYLPTFRDSGKDAVTNKTLDIASLDRFCQDHHLLMVFKFHSWGMIRDGETKEAIDRAQNIVIYNNADDIYPLLPLVDIMISDYSSVYMDFLLLDRPILFLTYDLDEYLKQERDFYFPYDELTPGRKCRDQVELHAGLERCLTGDDGYRTQRQALCRKTFKYADGKASQRVWQLIKLRNQRKEKET
jgi:CDP-glycerol glycerophosphotransferase